ncbi:DDE Tnp4 domain-containing protein [Mycena venus]|uniref:DDE Tnp4 domain-containing protein n=1 Tax=Mycena venus TaxID=2733690 RepID=A0A8H6Z6V1_9AGAR|nr:DDE Tnp4 domain-containing protein [Mycena venus]
MPSGNRRPAREKALLKAYVRHNKGRQRRNLLRRRAAARLRHQYREENPRSVSLDDFSSLSSGDSSESDSDQSSGDDWADILGADWRFASDILGDQSSIVITGFTSESDDDSMPDLRSVDYGSSSTDSEWDSWSGWSGSLSGAAGDDEESSDDESDSAAHRPARLRQFIIEEIDAMYANRYEKPRNTLPRGPSYLHHVLTALKAGRDDHFREALRVSPQTFDKLVARLENDPIFSNNSNQPQLSVEHQLAVALYRFGHDGNSASIQSVANRAGLGKGTVHLCIMLP